MNQNLFVTLLIVLDLIAIAPLAQAQEATIGGVVANKPVPDALALAAMVAGSEIKDCGDCPEMRVIPAGSFDMGSPVRESGRFDDEGPVRRVSVRQFALGKYEVTRGQFAAFVSATGHDADSDCNTFEAGQPGKRGARNWRDPGYAQTDAHPVVCVNSHDAKAYAAWLGKATGHSYRLPSEAEWEYAARAGSTAARYWGESADEACRYANVMDATGKRLVAGVIWPVHNCSDGHAYSAPAGSFKPNAFGLYDMSGNALEWTEDCMNENYAGAPTDGIAWFHGDCRQGVLRGGAWINEPRRQRSAYRRAVPKGFRDFYFGFRVARD